MLPVTIRRVFMARHRVDFRKQLNGLLGEAYRLGAQPYDGDCVLFVKKDHTQLRALVGDGVGLYLVCRRFEGGRLRSLLTFSAQPSTTSISTAELSLLLEGATFTVHKRARACRSDGEIIGSCKKDIDSWIPMGSYAVSEPERHRHTQL